MERERFKEPDGKQAGRWIYAPEGKEVSLH
jgi:hypothetical protein